MPDTPVVSISAGHPGDRSERRHIVVTHTSGWTERQIGSLLDATELANRHGLTLVPNLDDSFRWERLPQSWHQE